MIKLVAETEYFVEIEKFPNYFISSLGRVIRKSTLREISQRKRGNQSYCDITEGGKQTKLNVTKELLKYFNKG